MLRAAARAQNEGMAEFILVGNPDRIQFLLDQEDIAIHFRIEASETAAETAVNLVRGGEADLLMKGALPTSNLLKIVLDHERGLRNGERVNHIAVVESPRYNKLLFITDGGINLQFDTNIFCQIVENSARYVARFGITDPRIGILALVEDVTEKIPETVVAAEVVDRLQDRFLIEGPIAPDVALSRTNAERKGIKSRIAGEIDIMVMPNTTAANHLVKGLATLGNCLVGGIVVGATVPIILLSRSDKAETKYRSILLGLL